LLTNGHLPGLVTGPTVHLTSPAKSLCGCVPVYAHGGFWAGCAGEGSQSTAFSSCWHGACLLVPVIADYCVAIICRF
jgi:hypothetical protein